MQVLTTVNHTTQLLSSAVSVEHIKQFCGALLQHFSSYDLDKQKTGQVLQELPMTCMGMDLLVELSCRHQHAQWQ